MYLDDGAMLQQLQAHAEDLRKWISFYQKTREDYRLKQYEKYLANTLVAIDKLMHP
ncbi:hypothetical protein OMP38_13330 [Cohnella ginsengisoli]|uniref:Uncharacterized protein n=1 Tax=Cohnella ginsengisoli TaxID=425004 RepID=A0A9X4KLA3_9BACL|nr:hypothetical protein [Cohnella ginsengisoli]MDG0791745.1 hypothetical protein [Cohnella ginsengisoli]